MISGGPAPAPAHATLIDALANARTGEVTFVGLDEQEERIPWREMRVRAARTAAGLAARGVVRGDRVAIVLRTGPGFLDAFFGAMWLGAVPVPLYPPVRLGHLERYHRATGAMLRASGARIVITDRTLRWLIGDSVLDARPALGVVMVDDLDGATLATPAITPDDLALVQFSSGTTVAPKPVALAHRQLAAHLASLTSIVAPPGERVVGVSWLPLYHDMGLIGCLCGAAWLAIDLVLIAPEHFLAKPALWLRAIAKHRGTVSPAPSFAYALATAKIRDDELDGCDLSSWRFALDGAEAVSARAAERFAQRFARWGFDRAAIRPVYGLAEATLAVTFSRGLAVGRRGAVSVGAPVPGVDVDVRGGRVFVRGPSVMQGYLDRPDATAAAIVDGWLDTGDLGFLDGGELYVTGRAKDVVIVRGANRDPAELEAALDDVEGVRPGCAIAFSVPGDEGEALVILAEAREPSSELADRAAAAIARVAGLRPQEVRLLAPGTLPRTSSGKLRRGEARRLYLEGELAPPRAPSRWRLALHGLRAQLALKLRHA